MWTLVFRLIDRLSSIAETWGLPGMLLFSIIILVFVWASPEQKQALIDKLLLFDTVSHSWLLLVSLSLLLAFWGSRHYDRKENKYLRLELARLSKLKSEQQARDLDVPTHSSEGDGGHDD